MFCNTNKYQSFTSGVLLLLVALQMRRLHRYKNKMKIKEQNQAAAKK